MLSALALTLGLSSLDTQMIKCLKVEDWWTTMTLLIPKSSRDVSCRSSFEMLGASDDGNKYLR